MLLQITLRPDRTEHDDVTEANFHPLLSAGSTSSQTRTFRAQVSSRYNFQNQLFKKNKVFENMYVINYIS